MFLTFYLPSLPTLPILNSSVSYLIIPLHWSSTLLPLACLIVIFWQNLNLGLNSILHLLHACNYATKEKTLNHACWSHFKFIIMNLTWQSSCQAAPTLEWLYSLCPLLGTLHNTLLKITVNLFHTSWNCIGGCWKGPQGSLLWSSYLKFYVPSLQHTLHPLFLLLLYSTHQHQTFIYLFMCLFGYSLLHCEFHGQGVFVCFVHCLYFQCLEQYWDIKMSQL